MGKDSSGGDSGTKPVDARVARRRQDPIGRRLRQMYDEVVNEDVPDEFMSFLTALLLITAAVGTSLVLRTPFKVDVVRDRATLSRIVEGGKLENVYRLQVMNATEVSQTYRIKVSGLPGLVVASEPEVQVDAAQSRWMVVRLHLPYGAASGGSHPIHFEIGTVGGSAHISEKSVFLVPR